VKPFTNNTYGRNHYFNGPKEHKVPKSSSDRRGTRSSARQGIKKQVELSVLELMTSAAQVG
jgi:hypothetical protein